MSKIEWTIDDHNQSLNEGWLILNNGDITRIIRNDDLNVFENDRQALKHVVKMARSGSDLYKTALDICGMDWNVIRSIALDSIHINHCCKQCGCKYNDIDCPVVLGHVEAKYECGDHLKTFTMSETEVKQAIAQLEIYRNYFHMPEETFYAATPFKRMLQFKKDLN